MSATEFPSDMSTAMHNAEFEAMKSIVSSCSEEHCQVKREGKSFQDMVNVAKSSCHRLAPKGAARPSGVDLERAFGVPFTLNVDHHLNLDEPNHEGEYEIGRYREV